MKPVSDPVSLTGFVILNHYYFIMPSAFVLYASSRAKGNTFVIADYLRSALAVPAIDLSAHEIAPFSYENDYPSTDDFLHVIEKSINADHWVLVTPIYWYTMSAQMKTFMDRLSDLMKYQKDLLPLLTGKTLWVVGVGSDAKPVPHFFAPFHLSAEYLAMYYGGGLHAWLGRVPVMKPEVQVLLDNFVQMIKQSPTQFVLK